MQTTAITTSETGPLGIPKTIPKPRRCDIIAAMVERARFAHSLENVRLGARRLEAKAALNEEILREFNQSRDGFSHEVITWSNRIEIKFTANIFTPKIMAMRKAYGEIPFNGPFCTKTAKLKIQRAMDTSAERVAALLSSEDAVKAMDAALEEISKK